MGYCMSQRDAKFAILKDKKEAALQALKATASNTKRMGGGSFNGATGERTYHYAWVDMSYVKATTLTEAARKWRWDLVEEEDGHISDIEFRGEKLGDDERFFEALAPFVEDGSFIEMEGEDGSRWKWVFKDGSVSEKHARISYDED
jgi:hypothetical protein